MLTLSPMLSGSPDLASRSAQTCEGAPLAGGAATRTGSSFAAAWHEAAESAARSVAVPNEGEEMTEQEGTAHMPDPTMTEVEEAPDLALSERDEEVKSARSPAAQQQPQTDEGAIEIDSKAADGPEGRRRTDHPDAWRADDARSAEDGPRVTGPTPAPAASPLQPDSRESPRPLAAQSLTKGTEARSAQGSPTDRSEPVAQDFPLVDRHTEIAPSQRMAAMVSASRESSRGGPAELARLEAPGQPIRADALDGRVRVDPASSSSALTASPEGGDPPRTVASAQLSTTPPPGGFANAELTTDVAESAEQAAVKATLAKLRSVSDGTRHENAGVAQPGNSPALQTSGRTANLIAGAAQGPDLGTARLATPGLPQPAQEAIPSDPLPEFDLRFVGDPGSTGGGRGEAPMAKADLPRHMAMQLADAIQRGGAQRPVELSLNPTELGRVKISLTTSDGAVMVQVIADRPETLDLIRRHADLLAQEFHAIGYGEAQFSFSHNRSGSGESPDGQNTNEGAAVGLSAAAGTLDHADTAPTAASIITDRVDIRL